MRGFVFEHAANQGPFPQLGAVSVRSGNHWLIEDNIIRHAKTIGIDAGSETWGAKDLPLTDEADRKLILGNRNTVRNNLISDNGLCGLAAWHCYGLVVEGNRVERNNALGFRPGVDHRDQWEEHSGIKLHSATNARIEGNLVRDNDAHGIWIDNGFTNSHITRNVVLNNAGGGITLELGNGPALIDHNVVAYTRAYSGYYAGDGIYGHDASGITIAHNLSFSNARYGVHFRRITDRKIGDQLVEASNLKVLNNLLLDNTRGAISLPREGKRATDNFSDHNVISQEAPHFVFHGNPTPLNKEQWRNASGWDKNTVFENPRRFVLRALSMEIELLLGEKSLLGVPAAIPPYGFPGARLLPSGDTVIAGPWQHLGALNQRFFLWPQTSSSTTTR